MYLLRRVYKVKPGSKRKVAEIASKMGQLYHEAGHRSECRVYSSGNTVPGPLNTVYMDWIQDDIKRPGRPENKIPEGMSALNTELNQHVEESAIEFYELYVPPRRPTA